jgi:hypothetical protein
LSPGVQGQFGQHNKTPSQKQQQQQQQTQTNKQKDKNRRGRKENWSRSLYI